MLNAVILLIIMILVILSSGCIMHYRKPVSEGFGNLYTMLENEFEKFKVEDGIGMPPGVLRLKRNKDGEPCHTEGEPNQLIQSNVAFQPTTMEYVNGHPECMEVERVWPGQLFG